MKANLRPADRTPRGGGSRVGFLVFWLKLNTKRIITGRANCWLLHLSTLPSFFLYLVPTYSLQQHTSRSIRLTIFLPSRAAAKN